jgi:hypothetical protein
MTKVIVTRDCGVRRCKHCKELYRTDIRNRRHQKYCDKTECRRASKKAAQERWLRSEKGWGYFRGRENVERVRQWREAHPGYCKRKAAKSSLQDFSITQPIDIQGDLGADSSTSALVTSPLQDLCTSQPALLIGLIANLTGSALQDDIVKTTRLFICSGMDILGGKR